MDPLRGYTMDIPNGYTKEEEIMKTTWKPCFNIDSQAEYSWKKIRIVYLVESAWCRVL